MSEIVCSSCSTDKDLLLRIATIFYNMKSLFFSKTGILIAIIGSFFFLFKRKISDFFVQNFSFLMVFSNPFWQSFFLSMILIVVISLLYFTDSIFKRPTRLFWRSINGLAVFYLIILVIIVPMDKSDVRKALSYFDSSLNKPLPEKTYASACALTFENIYNQLDIFVLLHLFGWFFKTLILRDEIISWALSILFELLEYTFAYQLKNFNECWWDHWILDVLTCNWFGIIMGKMVIRRYKLVEYNFISRNMNFKQYVLIVFIIISVSLLELNAFYLKALLWLPTENIFNCMRIALISLLGSVSMREIHDFSVYLSHCENTENENKITTGLDDFPPSSKQENTISDSTSSQRVFRRRMSTIEIKIKKKVPKGRNLSLKSSVWLIILICVLESIIIYKFSKNEFKDCMPQSIKIAWCIVISIVVGVSAAIYKKNG